MQKISLDVWDKKYRLKDANGTAIDHSIDDNFRRVAMALSEQEKDKQKWYEDFYWALENGAIPAGRIMSNAGTGKHKPATSLINCTVSGTIKDSMHDIMMSVHDAAMTLKAGCGIGYEFSTLRPKGAHVQGSGSSTSGPLPFMDIFDAMCKTVSSAGGRRGAQMATFDIGHPDIEDYIKSKREDGRFRQFNLSCLITDEFMHAVKSDKAWLLQFCGKVYKTVHAVELWDLIMKSTYDFAEPGVIFIDQMNRMNNLSWCENIRATNPCGEQPLPPHGACLLGSIDLTKFVRNAFKENADFDWNKYNEVVRIFTRMLDNVVEIAGLPLQEQQHELESKRRHGMGITGLGSALVMLGKKYGGKEAVEFTELVCRTMAITGFEYGVELAKEKGCAPILKEEFTVTPGMILKHPKMVEDGFRVGDKVSGHLLMAKYSLYLAQFPDKIREGIGQYGCRFTHHTSIAPTGTISLSFGNNCSNGIEPSFAHKYSRNIIREGKKTKEKVDMLSAELLAYRELINKNADPEQTDSLPDAFVSADQIDPTAHIDMQAAAQRWVDSSISKTINIPTDYPFNDFKNLYMYAYEKGCKGCTTFRFNPAAFQGVLVKEDDLAKTTYRFTLEDGSTVELKGNEIVEYDGETHTAANLYDALKEGYYDRL